MDAYGSGADARGADSGVSTIAPYVNEISQGESWVDGHGVIQRLVGNYSAEVQYSYVRQRKYARTP